MAIRSVQRYIPCMLRFLLIFIPLTIAVSMLAAQGWLPSELDRPVDALLGLVWPAIVLFLFVYVFFPGLFYGLNQDLGQFWARLRHDRRELQELHRKIDHLDKPHHMAQLGAIYLQQGRYRKAIAWLESALKKNPASLDAQYKLALCHFAKRQYAEAVSLLERVHAVNPDHDYGQASLRLAQSHHRLGNVTRAGEVYERLLKHNAGHPEGMYHYALLVAQQGNAASASNLMGRVVTSVRRTVGFSRRRNRHLLWKARFWLALHGKR
jgi:tetratricopeptide (TPR) repeat protein